MVPMRPYGTREQLAKRRGKGLRLLDEGQSAKQVAATLGVTERSVNRWAWELDHPKPKATRPPGRPARLAPAQLKQLEQTLRQGAYAQGYAEDYWTLDRIARLIWDLFQVRYHPTSVWHLMRRLGWSSQKPQRQPFQRDEAAVDCWKRTQWPRIKKVS